MYPNEILAQAYREQMTQEAENARLVRIARGGSGRWSLSGLGRIFAIHPWRTIPQPSVSATQQILNARIR
jgi:hypothetical protein